MSVEIYAYAISEDELKLSAYKLKQLMEQQEEIYISFGRPNQDGWKLWKRICSNRIKVNCDQELINEDQFFVEINKDLIKDTIDYIGEVGGTEDVVILFTMIMKYKDYCLISLSH